MDSNCSQEAGKPGEQKQEQKHLTREGDLMSAITYYITSESFLGNTAILSAIINDAIQALHAWFHKYQKVMSRLKSPRFGFWGFAHTELNKIQALKVQFQGKEH